MTPPVTTDALVEALAKTLWQQSYAFLQEATWEEALQKAEAIPDGCAANSVATVRSKASEVVTGPLAPLLAAHQQVTAERDEARDLAYELKLAAAGGEDVPGSANLVTAEDVRRWRDEDARQLATATSELARLRAEGEAKDRALKAKAEEQVAYWRERQRAEKCLEDGVSEDGQTYTPIGDEAAWQAGYCNGRMSEADWWAKTFLYWPDEAARAATAREGA